MKKKHDAMIAVAFGKPKRDEAEGDEIEHEEEAEGERVAFDEFAQSIGIPEEKHDEAYRALKSMIRQCVMSEEKGEYGEE
jgi:hypothetical protein